MKTRILIFFACVFCACEDFLKENSQNMAYVETVKDLDEILIGECYLPGGWSFDTTKMVTIGGESFSNQSRIATNPKTYFPYIHLLDDDVSEYLCGEIPAANEIKFVRLFCSNVHHWQQDPFFDSEGNEIQNENWRQTWSRIAALNSIIFQMDEMRSKGEDVVSCNRVEGEARFLRAQYYFWLANLYGRPYSSSTASTDLCIPLKVTEEIEDRFFSRATTGEVYHQMVEDLKAATVLLRGISQETKYRANQTAAFILLSRLYLYMEDYESAVICADSALREKDYRLLDLNEYKPGTSAVYATSPEVVFTHGNNMMVVIHGACITQGASIQNVASSYTSSEDLINTFDERDLRLKAFFTRRPAPGDGYRCIKTKMGGVDVEVSDHMAIRLPEAYLNKAEALALLGRDEEAKTALQELREMRFAPDDLKPVNETGKDLISFIRDERRRELCFEGHRWFDLRRYAVNGACPYTKSIEHYSLAYDGVAGPYVVGKYVLKPYNEDIAAYMLPIPGYAIEFNEGVLTNELRAVRELIVE